MTTEQWTGVLCAVATALALVALVLALLARRRAQRAESQVAEMAARIGVLESLPAPQPTPRPTSRPRPDAEAEQSAYVITHVDRSSAHEVRTPVAGPIDGRLFVDIVARESVVKAASWTHGLRRALSAEHRNRVRFAVRQETRRAGRDRRAETKQALREFRARERAAAGPDAVVRDTGTPSQEDVA